MLGAKKTPKLATDERALFPVRTGVFREGGDVVIAFRGAAGHATLRFGRRGAAALVAQIEKAIRDGAGDFDSEQFLQCALTTGSTE
jgi:hypothetical protein